MTKMCVHRAVIRPSTQVSHNYSSNTIDYININRLLLDSSTPFKIDLFAIQDHCQLIEELF